MQRASWDDNHYHGNTGQLVDLQFRTMTGSYRTIKTVKSGTKGSLRATVTARIDGCYRWSGVLADHANVHALQNCATVVR